MLLPPGPEALVVVSNSRDLCHSGRRESHSINHSYGKSSSLKWAVRKNATKGEKGMVNLLTAAYRALKVGHNDSYEPVVPGEEGEQNGSLQLTKCDLNVRRRVSEDEGQHHIMKHTKLSSIRVWRSQRCHRGPRASCHRQ